MPRVRTWKVPVALWLLGFLAKIVFSILVSDAVGTWVGGTFGFFAVVTLLHGLRIGTLAAVAESDV
jgi:hypothetical protein